MFATEASKVANSVVRTSRLNDLEEDLMLLCTVSRNRHSWTPPFPANDGILGEVDEQRPDLFRGVRSPACMLQVQHIVYLLALGNCCQKCWNMKCKQNDMQFYFTTYSLSLAFRSPPSTRNITLNSPSHPSSANPVIMANITNPPKEKKWPAQLIVFA